MCDVIDAKMAIDAVPVSELVNYAQRNWKALPDWVKERYEKGGFIFLTDGINISYPDGVRKAGLSDYLLLAEDGVIHIGKRDFDLPE